LKNRLLASSTAVEFGGKLLFWKSCITHLIPHIWGSEG